MFNHKRILLVLVLLLTPILLVLAQDETMTDTVMIGGNDALGAFLVDANGMTLYTFTNDTTGVSNCADQCATNWPPLLVGDGESASLAYDVPGLIGVISRADDTRQVTFNGWPLYHFAGDTAAGDTNGQGIGDKWYVATPTDVGLGHSDTLGDFLVAANGKTLYTFANDTDGTSTCYDQCATNWPALTIADENDLSVQPGLAGEFDVVDRTDGTYQVTHNGQPLYFFAGDSEAGMTNGQGIGDKWYVDPVATIGTIENNDLGTILVGPNGMTLYMFANDTATESACVDSCAVNWPPLTVADEEPVNLADGLQGDVTTIERADGTYQVSFNGHLLYYFARDVLPGDTNGQGRGDVWYVVNP